MTPRIIVVTGGPGGGKTAVLELVRKAFCEYVVVLPEAASIIFGGGFSRKASLSARQAAQRAIFHVQREMERLEAEEGRAPVIFCDRGTLDGLAYWPGEPRRFFGELATSREAELSRYHAVIHMRTPGAEMGYNHRNPVRIETPDEAAAIDRRIAEAWEGHPRRHFVECESDFLCKAERAIDLLRENLVPCCGFGATQNGYGLVPRTAASVCAELRR